MVGSAAYGVCPIPGASGLRASVRAAAIEDELIPAWRAFRDELEGHRTRMSPRCDRSRGRPAPAGREPPSGDRSEVSSQARLQPHSRTHVRPARVVVRLRLVVIAVPERARSAPDQVAGSGTGTGTGRQGVA